MYEELSRIKKRIRERSFLLWNKKLSTLAGECIETLQRQGQCGRCGQEHVVVSAGVFAGFAAEGGPGARRKRLFSRGVLLIREKIGSLEKNRRRMKHRLFFVLAALGLLCACRDAVRTEGTAQEGVSLDSLWKRCVDLRVGAEGSRMDVSDCVRGVPMPILVDSTPFAAADYSFVR